MHTQTENLTIEIGDHRMPARELISIVANSTYFLFQLCVLLHMNRWRVFICWWLHRPTLPCLAAWLGQEMRAGEMKLVGKGVIRNTYLVAWGGRTLVVKTLRHDFETRANKKRVDQLHRWEAIALDSVSSTAPRGCTSCEGTLSYVYT